jgi:hypothetical protein
MSFIRTNQYAGYSNIQDFRNLVNDTGNAGYIHFSDGVYETVAQIKQIDYSEIQNTPTLFSGDYGDLQNTPTIITSYNALNDKPNLQIYALKTEITDFITQTEVDTASNTLYSQISSIDLTPYLTQTDINTFITQTEVDTASNALYSQISSIDLTPYLIQDDITNLISYDTLNNSCNYIDQNELDTILINSNYQYHIFTSNTYHDFIRHRDILIYDNEIKQFISQNSTATAYLYYDFNQDPLTETLITNVGSGVSIDGEILNSDVNGEITSYPGYTNHEQDLIAWYKFDDDFNDSSGSNNNLIETGATTPSLTDTDKTRGSKSALFNNFNTENLEFNENVKNMGGLYDEITISFWVKFSYTTIDDGIQRVLSFDLNNLTIFQYTSSDKLQVRITNGATVHLVNIDEAFLLEQWYHVAWVIKKGDGELNSVWKLYVDGLNVYDNSNLPDKLYIAPSHTNTRLGCRSDLLYHFLNGGLDDFRIYNKALSANEVLQVYGKTITKTTGPLPNTSAYYWNGNLTQQGDNACIKLPKEVIDPITTSTAFTIAYWHKYEDETTKIPILSLKYDNSIDVINVDVDSGKTIINLINNTLDGVAPSTTFTPGIEYVLSDRDLDTVFVCDAIFPPTITSSACLFEFGATGTGIWVGIRQDGDGTYFRARCGAGGEAIAKGESAAGCACVDIVDFPQDGLTHNVIVSIDLNADKMDIYIDGKLKGSNTSSGDIVTVAGGNEGFFGSATENVCVGETTEAWDANTGASVVGVLKQYSGVYLTNFHITTEWDITPTVSLNQWYHNAITMDYNPTTDDLTLEYYLDNVKQTTSTFTVPNFSLKSTVDSYGLISSNNYTINDASPSYLADFRIYTNVITETEISYLYNPELIPPQTDSFIKQSELLNTSNLLITYVNNNVYDNTDFDTQLSTKTTTDIAEGTNLYYTDGRFDNRLTTKSTDDIAEGTNLYYTDGRFDNRLTTKSTDDIAEGTNLYYTDARVNSVISGKQNIITWGGGLEINGNTASVKLPSINPTDIYLFVDLDGALNITNYTAGANVSISNGVISATNTIYTAGANVSISNGVISATNTIYTAGANVSISNGVISATNTTYTAGANITISNGEISATNTTYTAGDNITISNGEISATNTTYTAGANITISNGEISATGGTSLWSQSGNNIFYTAGNVGIGGNNYYHKLNVEGGIYVAGETSLFNPFNNVSSDRRERTYFTLGTNGTNSDWCYIRQRRNVDNQYVLSFEIYDDVDVGYEWLLCNPTSDYELGTLRTDGLTIFSGYPNISGHIRIYNASNATYPLTIDGSTGNISTLGNITTSGSANISSSVSCGSITTTGDITCGGAIESTYIQSVGLYSWRNPDKYIGPYGTYDLYRSSTVEKWGYGSYAIYDYNNEYKIAYGQFFCNSKGFISLNKMYTSTGITISSPINVGDEPIRITNDSPVGTTFNISLTMNCYMGA